MRSIFITGASSGIGAALARHYAAPETSLGLVARRETLLNQLADELEARGARVLIFPGDVSDTAFMQQSADSFVTSTEGVDLVVANAGVGMSKTLLSASSAKAARVWAVNLIGLSNTLVPFIPALVQRGRGVLVAMSSIAAFRALPGNTVYSASKAAIVTFMDGLRMELYGTGVHAMTICPGFVRTPLTERNRFPQPFMMNADRAARLMDRAIQARKKTYSFPWQMRLLKGLMQMAPEVVLRAVVSGAASRGP